MSKYQQTARQKARKATRKATAAEIRAVEWIEQNGGVLVTAGR